jgi:hypothetical protein
MTTTYTNITLLDIGQDEAADWLTENGYIGAVSPVIDGLTVIYDNVLREYADADEPLEELLKLASEISYEFGCVAWLVIVNDDTVLIYSLYIDGELMDSYGVKAGEDADGGDAELLADTFGVPKRAIKYVRAVLNRDTPGARDRHEQILTTLELPRLALGASYESIMDGALPEGVESEDELMIVEADEE